jgi:hypothetical protein
VGHRDELRRRAEALHARHYAIKAIARELDVAETTIRRWVVPEYAARSRRLAREAKRRHTGTCGKCGGKTTLKKNGTSGETAAICGTCAPIHYAPIYSTLHKGRGPVTERARELLAGGPMGRSELRRQLGISSDHVSVLLNRLVRQGYIERVELGVYQLCSNPKSAAATAAAPQPHKELGSCVG